MTYERLNTKFYVEDELNLYAKEEEMTKNKTHELPENEHDVDNKTAERKGADNKNSPADAQAQIQQLQEENAKLKDAYLRAYAESENTKKRCQQEIEKNTKFALASFAKELLSVADNLQRAIASVADDSREQCHALLEGVEMTQKELTKVFNKFGIKKIDSLGKVFDPNFEQAVQQIEDPEKPAGTVVAELQSAYLLNDRILREAMVIVTKGGEK